MDMDCEWKGLDCCRCV